MHKKRMRCRKHPSECVVGVCASCLRERLLNLLAQEEERSFEFTLSLPVSSPTFYEERNPSSKKREAPNLRAPLGLLLADSARQSKAADRAANTNPEGKPHRLKLSHIGASRFWKTPDVSKSKSSVTNRGRNEGFKEDEVAGSSPWLRRIENTFDEELPHKSSSWIYSWLFRKKRKGNHAESLHQANSVAGKSFMPAMSPYHDTSSKNCSVDLDLFNCHREASLRVQSSPIQHNLRVPSPNHYGKQESNYFSNSSILCKRGTKIWNIFKKNPRELSTPQRYREGKNSKADDSVHHRNGLFLQNVKGASPASVIIDSEDDQRASPPKSRGVACNANLGVSYYNPKAKAGKTEGTPYHDCAGSFSPYVERMSMQSPKHFSVVGNDLPNGLFCLSPLKKPGRKLYPPANL